MAFITSKFLAKLVAACAISEIATAHHDLRRNDLNQQNVRSVQGVQALKLSLKGTMTFEVPTGKGRAVEQYLERSGVKYSDKKIDVRDGDKIRSEKVSKGHYSLHLVKKRRDKKTNVFIPLFVNIDEGAYNEFYKTFQMGQPSTPPTVKQQAAGRHGHVGRADGKVIDVYGVGTIHARSSIATIPSGTPVIKKRDQYIDGMWMTEISTGKLVCWIESEYYIDDN